MNFDALAGLVQGQLLGQFQRQAEVEPMSVVFYSCPNGHQAVEVKSGPDNFPWLSHRAPDGSCLRCMGVHGKRVQMK